MSMDKRHGHIRSSVPAGEFKQRCLALLDQVAETGMPIVVTKRGKPVARVVPVEPADEGLIGSIRVVAEKDEDLFSTGESWDVEQVG
jgi:prevent-host-death family protein